MKKEIAKRRKNNKGFSLVELIIVIAIMAILVGILAPQFIKYVERSRVSTDVKNVQEIVSAIQVYAADSDNAALAPGAVTLTTASQSAATASTLTAGGANATLAQALTDAGIDNVVLRSSRWNPTSVVITVAVEADGQPTITFNQDGFN